MKTVVTGGAGFIGRHLVAALSLAGEEVVVFDNLRRAPPLDADIGARVRFIHGDLRNRDAVRMAVDGAQVVYHLGAQSNVLGAVADIDYSFQTNVVGTYHALVAARETGVARVVFSSSREVYGEVTRLPVLESFPLQPKNAYGASKAAGEHYCQVFQHTYGLDVSILRIANVYGPGDHDRVIPRWLACAQSGEPLVLYGGDQVLDFVPVGTVVQALLRAAATPLSGQPVNIGSGTGTRLRDLAARIQALPGVRSALQHQPARPVEVTRYVADVTRMRTLLGVEPPADPLADLSALWETVRG